MSFFSRSKGIVLLSTMLFMTLSTIVFADPPFICDDVDLTDYKHIDFYPFSALTSTRHTTLLSLPALEVDVGIYPRWELNLIIPIVTSMRTNQSTQTGLYDTELGLTYMILDEDHDVLGLTFSPQLELPTGNANRGLGNGKLWYQFPVWIGKKFGKWNTYGGGGYSINSAQGAENFWFLGWVLQRNITDKFQLGAEVYYQGADNRLSIDDGGDYTLLNIGCSYNYNSSLSFLFAAGHSIGGTQQWYGYLGMMVHV